LLSPGPEIHPKVAAVVPAAGAGTRLAAGETAPGPPKALRLLGGEPLLRHAVRSLEHAVTQVVVPAPADQREAVETALVGVPVSVTVVSGGASRQESVRRALAALDPDVGFVLVHDAARPLTPAAVTDRVVAALRSGAPVVVPAIPVVDTLRAVTSDASRTLDRARIRAVQTPQGFEADVLRRAHDTADHDLATDDASMAEALGIPVVLVEGDARAVKVTHPDDLLLAEALLARQAGE